MKELPRLSTLLPGVYHIRVDKHGRIVLPVELRRELHLEPGEPVSIRVKDGALRITSQREAIRQMQERTRELTGGREGLLDEFIADKRREAELD